MPPPVWLQQYSGLLLGLAFALGFTALAFQARDTWGAHRDWVVPTTVPFYALGGVALGHLLARRLAGAAAAGILLALAAVLLAGLDIWLDADDEANQAARDAVSIFLGIAIGLAITALAAGLAWAEATHPTKAPPPQA